jgi:hypothetical protein
VLQCRDVHYVAVLALFGAHQRGTYTTKVIAWHSGIFRQCRAVLGIAVAAVAVGAPRPAASLPRCLGASAHVMSILPLGRNDLKRLEAKKES